MYPVHITQSRERRPSVSWNEQKAARQLGPSLFPPQRPSGALPRATRVTTPRRTPARRPPSRCPRRRPPFPRRRIRPRRGSSRARRRARVVLVTAEAAAPARSPRRGPESASNPTSRADPTSAGPVIATPSPAPRNSPPTPRPSTAEGPAPSPPRGFFSEATSRGGRNASWSGLSRRTPTSSGSSPPSTRPRFDACSPTTRRARVPRAHWPASRETPGGDEEGGQGRHRARCPRLRPRPRRATRETKPREDAARRAARRVSRGEHFRRRLRDGTRGRSRRLRRRRRGETPRVSLPRRRVMAQTRPIARAIFTRRRSRGVFPPPRVKASGRGGRRPRRARRRERRRERRGDATRVPRSTAGGDAPARAPPAPRFRRRRGDRTARGRPDSTRAPPPPPPPPRRSRPPRRRARFPSASARW